MLELIKTVEKAVMRKMNYVNKNYPVMETKELVARNHVLKNPIPLEVGVRKLT